MKRAIWSTCKFSSYLIIPVYRAYKLALSVLISQHLIIPQNLYADEQSARSDKSETQALPSVVVTGTRTERPLSDAPVRTELIRRDRIEQIGSRTLADAVEFTTGVRVEDNCQNCNFSQIRLNGLPGSFSQILFDSQPTISSLAAVYGIEQIPSRLIERIEIVKGGASALYGPGAIGGVVNVIPYEPTKSGGTAEYRFEMMEADNGAENGANHASNGAFDYVSKDGYTLGTLFFQTDLVEPVDLTGDGFTEVSTRELRSFGGRFVNYFLDRDAKFVAMYTRADEYRRGGDRIVAPPTQVELAEEIDTSRDEMSTTWTHTISPTFDYRLNTAFAYVKRSSYYGAGGNPNAFGDTENPLLNFDSQFNHYGSWLGDHVISWGFQRRDEYLEDNLPGVSRFIDEHYFYTGGYLQDEFTPHEDLTLVVGARVDKHSELDTLVTSPRASIKYSPHDEVNLRAQVSTGFRAPQVFDEDLHLALVGGEGTVIRNDFGLSEERSISYQIGAEWTPPIGERGIGLIESNLFYTDIQDSFFNDPTDDPLTPDQFEFTRINRGGAAVYGVEFNNGYRFDQQFSLDTGLVLQRARYDEEDNDFGTRDFFRTPERYGVVSLSWTNNRIVDAFVGVKYTGPMLVPHYAGFIPADRLEESSSFVTLDASISRTLPISDSLGKQVQLTLGARNLTNEYQDDVDQGPLRDASYRYGPRFPRSYYVTATYRF